MRREQVILLLQTLIGSWIVLSTAPAWAAGGGCDNDDDCKGGRVCRDGSCVDPSRTKRRHVERDEEDQEEREEKKAEPSLFEQAPEDSSQARDIVLLRDGSKVVGWVVFVKDGRYVVVETKSGDKQTIKWGSIKLVKLAPEDARDEAGIEVGGDGISLSSESVTAVKTPPSTVASLAVDGAFVYGSANMSGVGIKVYGGGVDVGAKILTGGKLPGRDGGGWSGVGINPMLTLCYVSVNVKPDQGSEIGASATQYNVGVSAGYQYLSFGKLDPSTLKQSGYGVFLGYRAGYESMKVSVEGQEYKSTDFSHGPVVELTFPSYNAGTTHLSRTYISAMVLPTGDFLFVTIAAGFAF